MRIDLSKVFTAVSACLIALASASYAHSSDFTIGLATFKTSGANVFKAMLGSFHFFDCFPQYFLTISRVRVPAIVNPIGTVASIRWNLNSFC